MHIHMHTYIHTYIPYNYVHICIKTERRDGERERGRDMYIYIIYATAHPPRRQTLQ